MSLFGCLSPLLRDYNRYRFRGAGQFCKRRGICEVKAPKTQHSRRRVSLTPKLALFLRDYKAERETLYWQLAGKPFPLDSFAFGLPGKPCDPSMLSRDFAIIAKKAGFEGVRFHDLRHTFATLMLMRGAPAKVISEALGHASVAFTLCKLMPVF